MQPSCHGRSLATAVGILVLWGSACGAGSGAGDPVAIVVGDSLLAQSREETEQRLRADGWAPVIDGRSGATIQGFGEQFDWRSGLRDLVTLANPDVVVVELGTNGCGCDNAAAQVDAVMRAIGGVDLVLWVTVRSHPLRGDRPGDMNAAVLSNAARWPNLRLLDMKGEFEGHPEWIQEDGIHFTDQGAQAFAEMISDGIRGAL